MLKILAIPVLGLAILATAAAPAAAKRGVFFRTGPLGYPYAVQSAPYGRTGTAKWQSQKQFESGLDFETQAVHRNLRPTWFD
jgi:hypothetical protein